MPCLPASLPSELSYWFQLQVDLQRPPAVPFSVRNDQMQRFPPDLDIWLKENRGAWSHFKFLNLIFVVIPFFKPCFVLLWM